MSSILRFLKLLYEHKEKIILGALVIAFIGVGVDQWRKKKDGNSGGKGGKGPKTVEAPKPKQPPRKPKSYGIPQLGNRHPLDKYVEVANAGIFVPPKKETATDKETDKKEPTWAEIKVKSVFDATRSGSFIAIIEVDKKRMFVKEGEVFGEYLLRRIDGVRNCLTIVKRGSQSEEGEKEFCKED